MFFLMRMREIRMKRIKCFRCGIDAEVTCSLDSGCYPDIEICHDCAQLLVRWPFRKKRTHNPQPKAKGKEMKK